MIRRFAVSLPTSDPTVFSFFALIFKTDFISIAIQGAQGRASVEASPSALASGWLASCDQAWQIEVSAEEGEGRAIGDRSAPWFTQARESREREGGGGGAGAGGR